MSSYMLSWPGQDDLLWPQTTGPIMSSDSADDTLRRPDIVMTWNGLVHWDLLACTAAIYRREKVKPRLAHWSQEEEDRCVEQSWGTTVKASAQPGHGQLNLTLGSEPGQDQQSCPDDTSWSPTWEQKRHVVSTEVLGCYSALLWC